MTRGFPPLAGRQARALILGSLPSLKSLECRQYYGHPQNAFWKIMGALFGAGPELTYAQRTELLAGSQVAVWDVLAASVRPGSLDSAIDLSTAKANDFNALLRQQPQLQLVCFNGQAAAKIFSKLVVAKGFTAPPDLEFVTLPSTSPANAAMPYVTKLAIWTEALAFLCAAKV